MTAYILEKLCRGCQRCVHACPNGAIKMVAHLPLVSQSLCIECENCMEVCMQGAITFRAKELVVEGNDDGAGDNDIRALYQEKLLQLQKELADLKARWPAHSVKPELIQQWEELEEEIVRVKKQVLSLIPS